MRVGSGSSHTDESKIEANNLAYNVRLRLMGMLR